MEIKPEIAERIKKLEEKYAAMGQDLASYLDGLLYADYLTYWDYIHLDTLLSLQNPKTSFPDEEIFIIYHQITELYFKLCLHEMKQISAADPITKEFLTDRISRINRYFEALTRSFAIMINGMEPEQFLKFRMSLLPASGFQSAQYRLIEVYATEFIQLVDKTHRETFKSSGEQSIEKMFEHIYWKQGATELSSGKKTLTLRQFENKYSTLIIETAKHVQGRTLWDQYKKLNEAEQKDQTLINQLKQLDLNVNVNWPLVHYKSAVRYLQKSPEDIKATGGTNWQKYLPPRFQRRIFYPSLWTTEELENWGTGMKRIFDLELP
jgi:tryptophan 2,3-dioxygenase